MSGDENLERRLEAWLEATARPMPPELLEDVIATVPGVRPAGARVGFPPGRRWRFAIAALAAAIVVAVGLSGAVRLPVDPGSVTPEPSTSPAPTASATPTEPALTLPPASAASSASPRLGEWHRNNYNAGEEQLTCRESGEGWTCYYEIPDGSGRFSGENVTARWACPDWFARSICDNVVAVHRGLAAYSFPSAPSGPPLTISQEYILTSVGGGNVLQLYWVDQNVCPWYRTREEALAAPFECTFAPGVTPPG